LTDEAASEAGNDRTTGLANPLAEAPPTDHEDRALVLRARAGDRDALEHLVRRHQAWIYNLAVRMLYHPQDAEDATQEILIKALTRLSLFEARSSFRTWLYRIVVNHVLNTKRGRLEPAAKSFTAYGQGLDNTPDLNLPDQTSVAADVRLLVDEARIGCTSGMLLCLDRQQRLSYILGEIFEVTDTVGAELLEISRENFRQRLARARRDLHNFMNDKCGLVNQANPCRCARKTRGFMQCGYVDPENLLFAGERIRKVRDALGAASEAIRTLDAQCAEIYREHPFYESPDLVQALRRLLQSPDFRQVTELP
jgi:RNA polymerase sigma factor (sigma-70 family)